MYKKGSLMGDADQAELAALRQQNKEMLLILQGKIISTEYENLMNMQKISDTKLGFWGSMLDAVKKYFNIPGTQDKKDMMSKQLNQRLKDIGNLLIVRESENSLQPEDNDDQNVSASPTINFRIKSQPSESNQQGSFIPSQPNQGYRSSNGPNVSNQQGSSRPFQPNQGYRSSNVPNASNQQGSSRPFQPNQGYRSSNGPNASSQNGSSTGFENHTSSSKERGEALDLLGLKGNPTDKEINKAYRNLARNFHPDKNPGKEAEYAEKFKKLAPAKEFLLQTAPKAREETEQSNDNEKSSDIPEKSFQKNKAPEAQAPEAQAPEVKAPEVKVPEVKVPEVKVPEVKVPEAQAPESQVPESQVPEVKVQESQAPEAKAPEKSSYNSFSSPPVAASVEPVIRELPISPVISTVRQTIENKSDSNTTVTNDASGPAPS
jgi:DnaJ domain